LFSKPIQNIYKILLPLIFHANINQLVKIRSKMILIFVVVGDNV